MAYQDAANEVIGRQVKSTAMPRHISLAMREVWGLQPKFAIRSGSRPGRLLTHPRFRAAYDFLLLRAETGGADSALAEWWTLFQSADEAEQLKMMQPPHKRSGKSVRKRNYRRKNNDRDA
jgi:poly(A) polymerase